MGDKSPELPAAVCDWCGRQNPEQLPNCAGCGTPLVNQLVVPEKRSDSATLGSIVRALSVLFVFVLLVFCWFMMSMQQDSIWKWRVRHRVNPGELRTWAFQVLSNAAVIPNFQAELMLTNAPAYLTNIHQPEMILSQQERVEVVYGGGLYHWGLTIGDPNLPPGGAGEVHRIETWAPGIYYWNE